MRKRICLFFAAMLLCMSNIMAQVASGSCGDNITWKLSDDGELVIEGTGAMTDFSFYTHAPWYQYRESVLSVTIGEGVTHVGGYAFRDYSNLTTAAISASVTSIGNDAFWGTGLTSFVIPENSQLSTIGDWAFNGSAGLTTICFPANLTSIGYYAFNTCNFTSITCNAVTPPSIDNSFPSTDASALIYVPAASVEAYKAAEGWNKFTNWMIASGTCGDNLTWKLSAEGELTIEGIGAMTSTPWSIYSEQVSTVTIGEGVTNIREWAFGYYPNLTSITIPASVTTIGGAAFMNCSSLASVTIAENSQLVSIGSSAFKNCSNLTSFTLPASVTSIGNDAFWGTGLTSFIIPENSQLATIGDWAFNGSAGLTTISFPVSLTSIGYYAFNTCNFTSITCNAVTPPSIDNSFPSTDASALVYVPAASVEAY